MGALTSLDISSNSLYAEGIKLLVQALKGNQIMTALNISSNVMTYDSEKSGDMSGVAALFDVIPGMGALLSLDVSNNYLNADSNRGMDYLGPAVAASKITSLNIASNSLFKNGGIEVIFSMLDNGALTSLDLSSNYLYAEGSKIVAEAIKVLIIRLRSFWHHFHVHLTTG
jgi:hypothetical protein